MKKFFASFLAVLFWLMPPVSADTSMKANVLLAGETQTWLSGQKRRAEIEVPFAGKIVTITRVDRGVEWILNPQRKIYQERPIALPYKPSEDSGSSVPENQNDGSNAGDSSETPNDCVPELLRIAETRTIAGFKTTGFSASCGDGKSYGKIWMAPPLGSLAAVSSEWAAYYHEHAVALYANFPPQERAELIAVTEKFGDALKDLLASRLGKYKRFPPGVIMAVEGKFSNDGSGPSKTVYEVKEILQQSVDPGLFEIPAGYQKVPDITKAVLKAGLQNFQQMIEQMKKLNEAFQGSPLQETFQKIKKSFDDFMAKQKASKS